MEESEIKLGMHVRCVFMGHRFYKTGIINSYSPGAIHVKWDDGCMINMLWSSASSFVPTDDKESPLPVTGVESLCRQCAKKCTVGDAKCWWCKTPCPC